MLCPVRRALEKASDNRISLTAKEWPIQLTDQVDGNKEGYAGNGISSALPYIWTTYDRFSTFWLAFSLLRSVFHELYLQLLELINFTSLPSHCLDVAKFVVYPPGDRFFTIMISFTVLAWRLYQRLYNTYSLTMLHHLLEDEKRISEFVSKYFRSSSQEAVGTRGIGSNKLPVYDRFLRDLMCYKDLNGLNESESEKIWKLRPNRTLEARRKLIVRNVGITFVEAVFFVPAIMIPCMVYFFSQPFSDYFYVQTYPNCDPELGKLYSENKLALFSITAKPHRLFSLVLDFVQVFVIWFDTCTAIFATDHICFSLEKDLLIYWKEVQRKILINLEMARTMHHQHCTDPYCQSKIDHDDGFVSRNQLESSEQLAYARNRESRRSRCSIGCNECFAHSSSGKHKANHHGNTTHSYVPIVRHTASMRDKIDPTKHRQSRCNLEIKIHEDDNDSNSGGSNFFTSAKMLKQRRLECLEMHVADLHALMFDFFTEVERADETISDVLTTGAISWLSASTILSVYFILRKDSEIPLLITVAQVFALFLFSALTMTLLALHRVCNKSYTLFCSLMAYDQTSRKTTYMKLIDFFTKDRRRISFTIFHKIVFTPKSYITMIGWSISCYFVAYTLVKQTGTPKT